MVAHFTATLYLADQTTVCETATHYQELAEQDDGKNVLQSGFSSLNCDMVVRIISVRKPEVKVLDVQV